MICIVAVAYALLGTTANATLHEIPGTFFDPLYGHHGARAAQARPQLLHASDRAAGGAGVGLQDWTMVRSDGRTPGIQRTNFQDVGDLYAAMDAPYTLDAVAKPSESSDPDFWTIALVIAGLIAYQIRRKSRFGAIRIRPGRL